MESGLQEIVTRVICYARYTYGLRGKLEGKLFRSLKNNASFSLTFLDFSSVWRETCEVVVKMSRQLVTLVPFNSSSWPSSALKGNNNF